VAGIEGEIAALKADREEDRHWKALMEKELTKLQDYVIEQHDLGFNLVVQHTTFLYNIPTNEGKLDPRKAFHNGELVSLEDIPDDAEGGGTDHKGSVRGEEWVANLGVDVVGVFD